jgi:hypothetical protein
MLFGNYWIIPQIIIRFLSIKTIAILFFVISFNKNKENLMSCGNWNRCAILSKTPWVALLHDDDDLLLNNYIAVISKVLIRKKIK